MLDLKSKLTRFRKPGLPSGDGAPAHGVADGIAAEMGFLDHLEEMRWRIFKALGALIVTSILCLFFADWVIDSLLMAPTRVDFFMYRLFGVDATELVLQNRTITGQFFAYFGTVLAVGFILAMPLVLYQVWAFVEPGLYAHEKQGLRFIAVFATFFFVLGVSFGYLILTPLALQFFANFQISEQIINEFDITKYFSMVLMWTFGAGALFEMPVVVYFLASLGIVTAAKMRAYRKYALIIILIVAAFFTPPDPMSQLIMAFPLLGLYEASIFITAVVERRRLKEEAKRRRQEEKEEAERVRAEAKKRLDG
ncbi:MAG: twin-arginine translocase subunit TatC [Rhodothermales bacterium]